MGERWLKQLNRRRHDLFNYLQMLGGYLQLEDLEAVKRHVLNLRQLLEEESHICRLGQPELVLSLLELKNWAQDQEHDLEIVASGQTTVEAGQALAAFLAELQGQAQLLPGGDSMITVQADTAGLRLSWDPVPAGMEAGAGRAYYIAEVTLFWVYPGRD